MIFSEKISLLAMKSNLKAKYADMIIHRNKVIGFRYNYVISYLTQAEQCLL